MKTEIPLLTDQDELLTGYITCTRKRMGYQTLHIRHAGNDIGWWPWCLKDLEPQDLKYLLGKFQQFGRELYVPARDFNPCWPKHLPAILTSSEHTTAALQLDFIFILLKKLKQTNFCWQQDCSWKPNLLEEMTLIPGVQYKCMYSPIQAGLHFGHTVVNTQLSSPNGSSIYDSWSSAV